MPPWDFLIGEQAVIGRIRGVPGWARELSALLVAESGRRPCALLHVRSRTLAIEPGRKVNAGESVPT
jgi:hypothetical protein